jgi:elongation factor G
VAGARLHPDLADKLHITVPSDRALLAERGKFRTELVDTCLEQDDEAMEAYLTDGTVCLGRRAARALRKGTLQSAFTPVLCGSSYKNKGVQQVLDAVVDYLPAPTDVQSIKTVDADGEPIGERKCSDDEPFSALAFKVINDVYGALTFIRVYSGVLTKGASVQNSTRGKREKIGRMVEMFAKEANPVEEARAGDIIALVSLADTETGDTLCDAANPVVLERMRFPDPVISVSVKSKLKAEQEKFGAALGKMVRADPSLHLETDRETGQTILRGMGELHLEVTLDRMRTEFGVEGTMGEPQVAYRETFTKKLTEQYIHKKQTGGSGQFAEVWIVFEPLERSAGFEFVDKTVGGSVPKEFVPAVEKGLKMQKEDGVLAGYPTVDFRATLIDGSYHDVDSNALTFEIAAKACFREAIRKAGPILLEPVMKVETVTPGDYLGDVIGDLNRRRGSILDQLERGTNIAVVANVPLSEMFGYIGQLRGMTSGRASYTMEFSHYDPVPRNVADEVIAERHPKLRYSKAMRAASCANTLLAPTADCASTVLGRFDTSRQSRCGESGCDCRIANFNSRSSDSRPMLCAQRPSLAIAASLILSCAHSRRLAPTSAASASRDRRMSWPIVRLRCALHVAESADPTSTPRLGSLCCRERGQRTD